MWVLLISIGLTALLMMQSVLLPPPANPTQAIGYLVLMLAV